MLSRLRACIICSFVCCAGVWATAIQPPAESSGRTNSAFQTAAPQALVMDVETRTILFEKNAREPIAPSSMTKILTVYMVLEALNSGKLHLDDQLPVSERAWRMKGSRMFVEVGKTVSVRDLLQGVIVQSGNDASVVLAEALGGSEEAFSVSMTKRAKELGAIQTCFVNASGWPDEGHVSTAYDLALFAVQTLQDFPDAYEEYYKKKEFTYNNIKQPNRNFLVQQGLGDGVKTGQTDKGGYGLVGSSLRQGQRLLFVVNGLPNGKVRQTESLRLLEWAFREFGTYTAFKAGAVMHEASVEGGVVPTVPCVISQDVRLALRRSDASKVKAAAVLSGNLVAPVVQGQPVGQLVIHFHSPSENRIMEKSVPLYAEKSIDRAGLFQRLGQWVSRILWGGGS